MVEALEIGSNLVTCVKNSVPALVFGNRIGQSDCSVSAMNDRLGHALRFGVEYDAISPNPFLHRSCSLTINSLTLVATANTPVRVTVKSAEAPTLLIPFFERHLSIIDRTRLEWAAHESAVLMPACARLGEATTRSCLMVDLETRRLAATASAMLGCDLDAAPNFALDQARLVSLQAGSLAFGKGLYHLCQQVDALIDAPDQLAFLGVDELFYRYFALMLRPDQFFGTTPSLGDHRDRLQRVCDYISARFADRITLSNLERVSGLSARTLHNAFWRRYGCSPMQWLAHYRLDQVHQRLQSVSVGQTVSRIALDCGITRLGAFAAAYQVRFGELPSATLTRRTHHLLRFSESE